MTDRGAGEGSPRIGILLAHLNDPFQRDLWKAVRSRAREAGIPTVAFLGHGLAEPELRHRTSNALYRWARFPLVDRLVVLSQAVGTHTGPEAVSDLLTDLGLPAVSLGYELPGAPSVLSEGGPALRELIRHLVEDHGRTHFALLTGPAQQVESAARAATVRDELSRLGVTLHPELVADAQFSREEARPTAARLFDLGLPIDAVVCLNDHMAVGVMDYLATQGILVPDQVSVVGFDDLSESRWRKPALTTVHQPLGEMGRRSVDLLLRRREGGPGRPVTVSCSVSLRRSCGCPGTRRTKAPEEAEHRLDQTDRLAALREIGVRLQGAFDLHALAAQWGRALDDLGFTAGEMVLYRGPVHQAVTWTRAAGGRRTDRPAGPPVLPTAPGTDPGDWIVLPLVYQDEFLGHLTLRCDHDEAMVFETLRDQMSTAVKGTALMEASQRYQRDLEAQVEQRTKELRLTNQDLVEQISRRQELERVVQEVSNRTMQAIGQDIHDDLCQQLAGIGMLASVLEERLDQGPEEVRNRLTEIRGLLDRAVDRAHQYSRTLYPVGLEQHGLAGALQDLLDNFRKASPRIQFVFQKEGSGQGTDPAARLQIYRIAQELVANAVKHSGTELVLVRLVDEAAGGSLEVRDFGTGLGPLAEANRMGMRILRFRSESIGAVLRFQNVDPGLRAVCRFPGVPEEAS